MNYLRNKLTNVVTAGLDPNGEVYNLLAAQRVTQDTEVTPDPSVEGLFGGPYTVHAGQTVWEDVPQRRAAEFPNRCLVGLLDPAAIAADTRVNLSTGLERDITITAATYTPKETIKGADTNSRTISVIDVTESASPVTAAKAALTNGIESPAGVAKALTLEEAAKLKVKAGSNVVANSAHVGTGIADPGGLVIVTYTHN
jgi:hypothetical protein